MADSLYDFGRESFLGGSLDWDADTIKLVLVDEGTDTPNLATDQHLDDRAAGARVATSGAFASKTITAGVADAADVVLSAVSGASVESFDIYQDTGTESTSILIANIDSATGLPFTPSGSDVTVQWSSGSNKIFKL